MADSGNGTDSLFNIIRHPVQGSPGPCEIGWDYYYVGQLSYPMSGEPLLMTTFPLFLELITSLDVINADCLPWFTAPIDFQPVMFYYADEYPVQDSSPFLSGIVTICQPTLKLWDVKISVDLLSKSITSLEVLSALGKDLGTPGDLSKFAGNVTDAPLFQQAYNGMFFANLTGTNTSNVQGRLDAVKLSLPATVLQASIAYGLDRTTENPSLYAELARDVYVRDFRSLSMPCVTSVFTDQLPHPLGEGVLLCRIQASIVGRNRVHAPEGIFQVSRHFLAIYYGQFYHSPAVVPSLYISLSPRRAFSVSGVRSWSSGPYTPHKTYASSILRGLSHLLSRWACQPSASC